MAKCTPYILFFPFIFTSFDNFELLGLTIFNDSLNFLSLVTKKFSKSELESKNFLNKLFPMNND